MSLYGPAGMELLNCDGCDALLEEGRSGLCDGCAGEESEGTVPSDNPLSACPYADGDYFGHDIQWQGLTIASVEFDPHTGQYQLLAAAAGDASGLEMVRTWKPEELAALIEESSQTTPLREKSHDAE